jgi:hypothetical protein
MPHFPKSFFKESRGVWYVEIDRKQHNLGPDRVAAFARYHELMRKKPTPVDVTMALGAVDAFFGWVKSNKAPTYRRVVRAASPRLREGHPVEPPCLQP